MNVEEFLKNVIDNPELMNICARYVEKNRYVCPRCGKPKVDNAYYHVENSLVYKSGRLPICKKCTGNLFNFYRAKYGSNVIAMEKLCLLFDLCFKEEILAKCGDNPKTIVGKYIKNLNLRQYKKLDTYDLSRKTFYFPYLMKIFR